MKILLVHPSFGVYGGAEKLLVVLMNYLTEHNHNVTLLTTEMISDVRKDIKEARLILCENLDEMYYSFSQIEHDFDIVNFHNAPVQLFSIGKHGNYVWTCNEPPQIFFDTGKIPNDEIEVVKNFIKTIVVSDQYNRERFKNIYGMDPIVSTYGVDPHFGEWADAYAFRTKYGMDSSTKIVTQVAWIHPMKNQEKTIEIFRDIKKEIPYSKLILAGYEHEEYKKQLLATLYEWDMLDDVIFAGFLGKDEVEALYRASDIVLQPIKNQGGWLAVLEAAALGKVVLVSEEMVGAKELKEKQFSKVLPISEMANKAVEILKDFKYQAGAGLANMEIVEENYTWDRYCEDMLAIYRKTMG